MTSIEKVVGYSKTRGAIWGKAVSGRPQPEPTPDEGWLYRFWRKSKPPDEPPRGAVVSGSMMLHTLFVIWSSFAVDTISRQGVTWSALVGPELFRAMTSASTPSLRLVLYMALCSTCIGFLGGALGGMLPRVREWLPDFGYMDYLASLLIPGTVILIVQFWLA